MSRKLKVKEFFKFSDECKDQRKEFYYQNDCVLLIDHVAKKTFLEWMFVPE